MPRLLIIGAKSDIAVSVAKAYAAEGYNLYLAAKNSASMKEFASDLQIRYDRKVSIFELDVLDTDTHQSFYDKLNPAPDGVLLAAGYLGDHELACKDFEETARILDTNYRGCVSMLNIIANDFEKRKAGFIAVISSVAGDRGRQSNYYYGSAKAALSAYLSGLRNRLTEAGVQVITIKPGFVRTRMTEGMDLPPLLTAQPDEVAGDILSAQKKGKDIIYSKWLWRYIMFVIRIIPERIFKKLKL